MGKKRHPILFPAPFYPFPIQRHKKSNFTHRWVNGSAD
jgi:hypothetical protein